MARSFHQSLLAAAVAVVVGGSALAQDTPLQEAVTMLRLGKKDEALSKLREILASDPSSTDALAMYRSIQQEEWYLLMTTQGEIQQVAQSILERAKVERNALSRDAEAIEALVVVATSKDSDYPTRQKAVNTLIAQHGEFAVPALVKRLGNKEDEDAQILAIETLSQLRNSATLPLIEALKSSEELVVRNAAAALHQIGDDRAIPAMARLEGSTSDAVSKIAKKFLAKKGAAGNAVDLLLAQSKGYLSGSVPAGAMSSVVWQLVDDQLVATEVAPLLYPTELAKSCAADAVKLAPSSVAARSSLAQAYLAQTQLIENSIAMGDEATKALEPVVAELRIAAMATGTDALRGALEAGLKDRHAVVATGAIKALSQAELIGTIDQSSLVAALQSTDKRVRYAAADALVRASGGAVVPQASTVVAVLAEAVTEEAVRTIQVIDAGRESAAAAEAASRVRGNAVDASASAVEGMHSLLVNPNVDVVVINENLPDRDPADVIGNIKKDTRMANTRVLVVAKDVEKAKERFGDSVGVIQGPLTGEGLVAAVNTALEGVTTPSNLRAEAYASQASESLLAIASQKGDISGAIGNIAKQLNRGDAVAVPAAKALGLSGSAGELPALVAALGAGSLDLKKASAEAIGRVLGRMSDCPEDVSAALIEAMKADADVGLRQAIAIALGKAKMAADKKASLIESLKRIASTPTEG